MHYGKRLAENLLNENVQLKTSLSKLQAEYDYLTERNSDLNTSMNIMKSEYEKEIHQLKSEIESLKNGMELKSAYEYIEHLKKVIAESDALLAEYRAKQNFTDLQRIHLLELELEDLKSRTEKNPFHAGRKKNSYLENHVLKCIRAGMKAKEIIGSEYLNSCNGKIRTVSQASYYRLKKQFIQEGKIEGKKRKTKATAGKRSQN